METLRLKMPPQIDEEPDGGQAGVRIRRVEDLNADWPQVWPLLDAYERHHATLLGGTLLPDREARSRRDLERRWTSTLAMVAATERGLVGTACAYLRRPLKGGGRSGYRNRLYIDPAYRGLGIAARFETVATRWFRDHGVTEVEDKIAQGNERPREIRIHHGYEPVRVLLRKSL
jgi:GNAT superfamily N-acetyltransferase